MKIPFSYRHHFFSPILFASFFGHTVVLAGGSFLIQPAHFSVEQAPSSMEVLILKETEPVKEKPVKQEKMMTVAESSQFIEKKPEPKKITEPKRNQNQKKTIYIPPTHGAIEEPRPDALKNRAPVYPVLAREKGWEGIVILKVSVHPNGGAGQVMIDQSSGHTILDEAAVSAVRNWQFYPAKIGPMPLSSRVKIPIRFVLEKDKNSFPV